MKLLTLFSALILILSSCKENIIKKIKVKPDPLTESEIYKLDQIKNYLFSIYELDNDSIKKLSDSHLLAAMDDLYNKKKYYPAREKLIESILIYPNSKNYLELARVEMERFNVLNENNLLNEARQALEISDYLSSNNLIESELLKIKIINLDKEESYDYKARQIKYHLFNLFKMGYSDTLSLTNNSAINQYVTHDEFSYLFSQSKIVSNQNFYNLSGTFNTFVLGFPVKETPIEITAKDLGKLNELNEISYEFAKYIPEMENTDFGRDVSHFFYAYAVFKSSENFISVIYASQNFMEEWNPNNFLIANFDLNGKRISELNVAGIISPQRIKTCSIENGKIKVEEMDVKWKEKIGDQEIEKNEIQDYTIVSTSNYQISESGKFELIDQKIASK